MSFDLDMSLPDLEGIDDLTHPSRLQLRDNLAQNLIVRAQDDLLVFTQLVFPDFQIGPHHRLLAENLELLEKGTIKRLMFFLPPRSSKSLMASTIFPAWVLGRHMKWFMMGISYGADLAKDFGRSVRDTTQLSIYKLIFPEMALRQDVSAANKWYTKHGGQYNAAGTTGGIAGKGAHIGIIDDPLSEQDAWSKAARLHVQKWYPAGFRSRLQPGGRIAIVMTRWHDDDLAGYLLKLAKEDSNADQWTVIDVPAIIEDADGIEHSYWPTTPEGDKLAEEEGIHTGWPLEELQSTRSNMPPYQWNALYLQKPSAQEGAILKREWWKDWGTSEPPQIEYKLQSWDTAFSAASTADYSAITIWGVFRDYNNIPNLILLGSEKGRWEYPELRIRAQELYEEWNPDGVLVEKKASGQSLLQDLRAAGVPVIEFLPDKDKIARAHACTPLFHAGRIHAPDRRWAEIVIDECATFPSGANDDLVDTVTQAVLWLKMGTWVTHPDDDYDEDDDNPKQRRKLY